MKPETYGINGLILKSLAMSNYMFLLRLLFVAVLLISYLPVSYAQNAQKFYKDTVSYMGTHLICDKKGVENLLEMRIAQWKEMGFLNSERDLIPKKNCIRREAEIIFLGIAQEYSFPYEDNIWRTDPNGQYPCPWDPDKNCVRFEGLPVQYARVQYRGSDGYWREGVFAEIAGDALLEDYSANKEEEGSNLGDMYADGEGVPEDDVEAARWHRLATEQRDAEAQHSLGWMYDNGLGVPEDDLKAVRWYRMAAEQGYAKSQFNLGIMYAAGEGVPEDDVQAYVWLSLAAAQGIEPAEEMKQTISGTMTGEAIASAQELSEKYRDAYGPVRILE